MGIIILKNGKPDYFKEFSDLLLISAPSLFLYLFGSRRKEVVERLFIHPKNFFSFEHAVFAEIKGEIAGMALGYSFEQKVREELHTGLLLAKYLRGDFLKKLPYLLKAQKTLGKIREGEYYLSNIAVYPEFRGLGLGTKMLEEMENRAKMLNCKSIILDVEVENEKAIKLYKKLGYEIVKKSFLFQADGVNFEFFKMKKAL
jgi:ribosomal protein S18 acetylase RimI-like enzyme